jgi:hypothetical protein
VLRLHSGGEQYCHRQSRRGHYPHVSSSTNPQAITSPHHTDIPR